MPFSHALRSKGSLSRGDECTAAREPKPALLFAAQLPGPQDGVKVHLPSVVFATSSTCRVFLSPIHPFSDPSRITLFAK